MELIYYWINKKKCIHEQGFCFSPEYNISMLKVEQGKYELKISRKKENNETVYMWWSLKGWI